MEKLLPIAEGLVQRGYPVTFPGGPLWRKEIEQTGASFLEIEGEPTTPGFPLPEDEMNAYLALQPGTPEFEIFPMIAVLRASATRNHRALQKALRQINDPRTILLFDILSAPANAVLLGAPGLRPHSVIGLSTIPLTFANNDTMPFNSGSLPDTSSNAREIHFKEWRELNRKPLQSQLNAKAAELYAKAGAKLPPPPVDGGFVLLADILCAMSIPQFDFKRTDTQLDVRYIGMPKTVGMSAQDLPDWWQEMLDAKAQGKKIVAVSRSSMDRSMDTILLPTLEGLRHNTDVLVVAALVNSEVEEVQTSHDIPTNVRLAKFIPMNVLLPHVSPPEPTLPQQLADYTLKVDVLVSSAGYGTVQHALRNGVPLILVGSGADKLETGTIAMYTGVGIHHQEAALGSDTVRKSVEEILRNPNFKEKAQAMKRGYQEYNPIEKLDKILQERALWFNDLTK